MVCAPIGVCPLCHTGHLFPCGWSGGPHLLALSPIKKTIAAHLCPAAAKTLGSGLFGDAMESIIELFEEAQKHTKAMSYLMLRQAFQQTARSRSLSASGSSQWRGKPSDCSSDCYCSSPGAGRKAWGPGRKNHGQQRSSQHDSLPPLTDKLLS